MEKHELSFFISLSLAGCLIVSSLLTSLSYWLKYKHGAVFMEEFPFYSLVFLILTLAVLGLEMACQTYLGYAFLVVFTLLKMFFLSSYAPEFSFFGKALSLDELKDYILLLKCYTPYLSIQTGQQQFFIYLKQCKDITKPMDIPSSFGRCSLLLVSFYKYLYSDTDDLETLNSIYYTLSYRSEAEIRLLSRLDKFCERVMFVDDLPFWFSPAYFYLAALAYLDLSAFCLARYRCTKCRLLVYKTVKLTKTIVYDERKLSSVYMYIYNRTSVRYVDERQETLLTAPAAATQYV